MTELVQYLVAGVAIGSLYALVALGFVIIFKATGVINLAQGGLLLLGTYLTYGFRRNSAFPSSSPWSWPWSRAPPWRWSWSGSCWPAWSAGPFSR